MINRVLVQIIPILFCFNYLLSNIENTSKAKGLVRKGVDGIPQDSEEAYLLFKRSAKEYHLNSKDQDIVYHMRLNEDWERALFGNDSHRETDSKTIQDNSVNGYSIIIDPEVRKSLAKDPVLRQTVSPEYPINLKARGVTGEVLTSFFIDEEGNVISPTVVKTSNRSFNDNVINALRQWKFSPAERNGEAVEIEARLLFLFSLKSR